MEMEGIREIDGKAKKELTTEERRTTEVRRVKTKKGGIRRSGFLSFFLYPSFFSV